jgi:hypothetical protein
MISDYRSIMKKSKTIRANQDVGASMAEMQSKLEALNASMAPTAQGRAITDGVLCSATVTSIRQTGAMINMAPACEIGLLVLIPGRPPLPLIRSEIVPTLYASRALPGQQVSVRVMADDPDDLFIDWAAP